MHAELWSVAVLAQGYDAATKISDAKYVTMPSVVGDGHPAEKLRIRAEARWAQGFLPSQSGYWSSGPLL